MKNLTIYHLHVRTQTALHVGGESRPNDPSDSLFRRRTDGNWIVPGTGIAGALRGHLTRITPALSGLNKKIMCDALTDTVSPDTICDCIVCHLMGDLSPVDTARASRLIVNDAVIHAKRSHIRDSVGIERMTGTAAREAGAKFDVETIPAKTEFIIKLELEDADDIDRYLVDLALAEWAAGRVLIGGNTSRGLGALEVQRIEVERFDFNKNAADVYELLTRQSKPQTIAVPTPHRQWHGAYTHAPGSMQHWAHIEWTLAFDGFYLTDDVTTSAQTNINHVSLPILPGSSVRGVLRSQAERIARTLAHERATNEDEFLQICAASDPLVRRSVSDQPVMGLESSAVRIEKKLALRPEQRQQPDETWFDLSERLFGSVYFGSRLKCGDGALISKKVEKSLDFVAIDRFTGGAAEGLKFDAKALWQPHFRCRLLLESPQGWELGWLLYALNDAREGRLTFGFGAAKGFGACIATDFKFTFGWAHEEAFPFPSRTALNAADETFFRQVSFDGWESLASYGWLAGWAQDWLNEVNTFQVHPNAPHTHSIDPYWSLEDMMLLYPKAGA